MVAHLAAGGAVAPLPALVAVAASAALGLVVVRGAIDPARTFALALLTQVVWHASFIVTSSPEPAQSALGMLLGHLLAAALTTVVSLGLERELLLAARRYLVPTAEPVPGVGLPVRPRLPVAATTRVSAPAAVLPGCLTSRAPPG